MNLLTRKIQTLCEQAGMTQADLVRKSGLAASIISRAWNGGNVPNERNMLAIAEALEAKAELMAVYERVRMRDEQIWLGFPADLLCAPAILLAQRFIGQFVLEAGHSCETPSGGGMELQPRAVLKLAETPGSPKPLTHLMLRTALLDGTLDAAFVPRSLYLAHRDTLTLYAELSVQAFAVCWLLITPIGKPSAVSDLDAALTLNPEFAALSDSEGEREFGQLRQPAENGLNLATFDSALALLEGVRTRLVKHQPVIVLVGEPLASWLTQSLRTEDAGQIAMLQRQPADYLCEALPRIGRASMCLVLSLDGSKRAQPRWIQQILEKLLFYIDSVNRREDTDLNIIATSLAMPVARVREALGQMGLFELSLVPQALKLLG